MKRTIEWHKNCYKNTAADLERQEQTLQRLQQEFEKKQG